MKLNEAISVRLTEILTEREMTKYKLFKQSGVPRSTINNIIHCSYDSVKLRIIYELCQGLDMELSDFFNSPIFNTANIDD